MTHNKRSKLSRARGSWTHGGGSKKKRRGAGHRGGRGRAGSGKKGDAKKPRYWKDSTFGKKGFTSIMRKYEKTINVEQLDELLIKNKLTKISLTEKGYTKLLGAGTIKTKAEITVDKASSKAVIKIEKAGGKINLKPIEVPKEKPKKEESKKEIKKDIPKKEPAAESKEVIKEKVTEVKEQPVKEKPKEE